MADTPVSNASSVVSPVSQDHTSPAPHAEVLAGAESQAQNIVEANRDTAAETTQQVAGKGGSFDGMDILDNQPGGSAAALNNVTTASGSPVARNAPAALNNNLGVDRSVVAHNLDKPAAGHTETVHVQPGEVLSTTFDPNAANLEMHGKDLVMQFNDGSKIVLTAFASDLGNMPSIALPNGALVAGGIIIAQLQGTQDDIFNLETAAGGAATTSGRFAYSDDFGTVIGLLDKLPPIGFTALVFPQPEPRVVLNDLTNFNNQTQPPVTNNGLPTAENANLTLDETSQLNHQFSGSLNVNFGADGAGGIAGNSVFSVDGSLLAGGLTSNGALVSVSQDANGNYVGTANGTTVFTMNFNADGTYTFNQLHVLDHGNPNDPNDVINLNFGYSVRDANGDTVSHTVSVHVLDDAPVANDDTNSIPNGNTIAQGNLLTNDVMSHDVVNHITQVSYGNVTKTFAADGLTDAGGKYVLVDGQFGQLKAYENGKYTYTYDTENHGGSTNMVTYGVNQFPADDADAFNTPKYSVEAVQAAWSGVKLYTFDLNAQFEDANHVLQLGNAGGDNGKIVYTAFGIGVYTDENPYYEISQPAGDPRGEGLAIDLQQLTTRANVQLALMYSEGNGPDAQTEHGEWFAYNAAGQQVGHGDVTADNTYAVPDNGGYGSVREFAITTVEPFQYVLFRALPQVDGVNQGNGGADGSDYVIHNISIPAQPDMIDKFTYVLTDGDGDHDPANLLIGITDYLPGGAPIVSILVDETGDIGKSVSDKVVVQSATSYVLGNNAGEAAFSISGSAKNDKLTSNGVDVKVSLIGGHYVGMAGEKQVFDLKIANDGTYTFVLKAPLDHANGADPNDNIALAFNYTARDSNGDASTGNLIVNVRDDAPLANDDAKALDNNVTTASGNVLENDVGSKDVVNHVDSIATAAGAKSFATDGQNDAEGRFITISGQYGALKIYTDGHYTYTYDAANHSGQLSEDFSYKLVDGDGDSSTANLHITITDTVLGVAPNVVATVDETTSINNAVNGVLTADASLSFALGSAQGAPSFSAGGSLKDGALFSHGVPVTVSLVGGHYVGMAGETKVFDLGVNGNGTYTFVQTATLDHANGANPDDVINLNFAYTTHGANNQTSEGHISVSVVDDAPVAHDDIQAALPDSFAVVSGNVLQNDTLSHDTPNTLEMIVVGDVARSFDNNGQTDQNGRFISIDSTYGTLKIYQDGNYTFVPDTQVKHGDVSLQYTYLLKDGDGDTSSAHLILNLGNNVVANAPDVDRSVDETNSINHAITGSVSVENATAYLLGTSSSMSGFSASGSLKGDALYSGGKLVSVLFDGNQYTAKADGQTIFTLVMNKSGEYAFTQYAALDHKDGSNPDDVINLHFNYVAQDQNGNFPQGNIVIHVLDDAPIAHDDTNSIPNGNTIARGDLLVNDVMSHDTPTKLADVSAGSSVKSFATDGLTDANGKYVLVDGQYGQLKVYDTGKYTYTYDTEHNGGSTNLITFGPNQFPVNDADSLTPRFSAEAVAAAWSGAKLYTFDLDAAFENSNHVLQLGNAGGDNGKVVFSPYGIGVYTDQNPYYEISQPPGDMRGEGLAIDLQQLTTRANVQLALMYSEGNGPDAHTEHGEWFAYNAAGQQVGHGDVTADNTYAVPDNGGYGSVRNFAITTVEPFQYVLFRALPQVEGVVQGNGGADGSDFTIYNISIPAQPDMLEQFNYHLADRDGDTSGAHLVIGITDYATYSPILTPFVVAGEQTLAKVATDTTTDTHVAAAAIVAASASDALHLSNDAPVAHFGLVDHGHAAFEKMAIWQDQGVAQSGLAAVHVDKGAVDILHTENGVPANYFGIFGHDGKDVAHADDKAVTSHDAQHQGIAIGEPNGHDAPTTGSDGSDTFTVTKDQGGTSEIAGFNHEHNDKLDISDLLVGSNYKPGISHVDDFVKVDHTSGNVFVDAGGQGHFDQTTHVATINNSAALDSVNIILHNDEGTKTVHTV